MHLREAGLPLGSLYGTSAISVLVLGALWYEHGFRRMRKGVGFIEVRLRLAILFLLGHQNIWKALLILSLVVLYRRYEIGMAMIAGLTLSTAVLLLVDHL